VFDLARVRRGGCGGVGGCSGREFSMATLTCGPKFRREARNDKGARENNRRSAKAAMCSCEMDQGGWQKFCDISLCESLVCEELG
jgi:hypothetical protein